MTTVKIITETMQTFVGKVMSLLLNIQSVCHSFPSKDQAGEVGKHKGEEKSWLLTEG